MNSVVLTSTKPTMQFNSKILWSVAILLFVIASCNQSSNTQSDPVDPNYDPEARLVELGITLPSPPQPVANYVNDL